MKQHTLKKDKFRRARGGYSRFLEISCNKCTTHLCYYQKDGPGILKRMYVDRLINFKKSSEELSCPKCKELLGVKTVYKKEKRPAYRLFEGAVVKKIVQSEKVGETSGI